MSDNIGALAIGTVQHLNNHDATRSRWRFAALATLKENSTSTPVRHLPIKEFLANGAAQRLHVERLPAYAPELNPGEGLWQQLKGVELRNVCCVDIPHLRGELRDAVKRVRRKPRMLKGCFQGAGL